VKKIFKKKWFWFLIIMIMSVFFYYLSKQNEKEIYDFIVARKTNLIQEVNVTGKVKPVEEINLAFEISGKIEKIYFDVGSQVAAQETLVELAKTDLLADLEKAKASIKTAKAQAEETQASLESYQALLENQSQELEKEKITLLKLKRGARAEEIKVSETKVAKAQQALDDAEKKLTLVKQKSITDLTNLYNDVLDIINTAYTTADGVVNEDVVDLFDKQGNSYNLKFTTANSQAKIDAERARGGVQKALNAWQAEINSLTTDSYSVLDQALNQGKTYLEVIKNCLTKTMNALNYAVTTSSITETTLNNYRSSTITAKTNINTEISNINTQKQAIVAQKNINQANINTAQTEFNATTEALKLAQDELALLIAPASTEEIQTQETLIKQAEFNLKAKQAQVKQAEASLKAKQAVVTEAQANAKKILAQIEKTKLKAPITATLAKQDIELGEIISANTPIITLISKANLEIEAKIPEADIAKVKLNDKAIVTLDAYTDDVEFQAFVQKIDQVETMVDGVSTYKVKLNFVQPDQRIRSGMTANLDIITAQKNNIIAIPARAVISNNGDKKVRLLSQNGFVKEKKVTTGLRGSLGNIEITSGINPGDKVIVFVQDK